MNLLKDTVTAIHSMGYDTPTNIQEQAIPYLLDGRDVVGQAQTGSGKTASFGIPIVERITPGGGAIQAIVLVPTRELATQVADEIASIGRTRGIAVVPVYGGQPINRQLRLLDNRPEVLVGTPGRVMDHISRGTVALNNVRVAVLDEAGRDLPGQGVSNCDPVNGDSVRHHVRWDDENALSRAAGQPVQLAFHLEDASLYAFQFRD